MNHRTLLLSSMLLAAAPTACAGPGAPGAAANSAAIGPPAAPVASTLGPPREVPPAPMRETVSNALPIVIVHKSPTCGCCGAWVEHMRSAGFEVDVRDSDSLDPIKRSLGVPADKASCHTAQIGDYFIEGHVPAEDVKRLLAERPIARGLAVPGMPAGSPGMEVPVGREQPYSVDLVAKDGSSSSFAQH